MLYIDSIPYFKTQIKKIFVPVKDIGSRNGTGVLIFPLCKSVADTFEIINNKDNCIRPASVQYMYYYNLLYSGRLNNRRYYIKDTKERKNIYANLNAMNIAGVKPHPLTLLGATANKNTYFEMSKYFEIYTYMTKKLSAVRRLNIFWNFFRSIWFSQNTVNYPTKVVVINAEQYSKFNTYNIRDSIDNPLFIIYYTMYKYFNLISDLDIDIVIYYKNNILKINPSKADSKTFTLLKTEMNKIFNKLSFREIKEELVDTEIQKDDIKENLVEKYQMTGPKKDVSDVTHIPKPTEEIKKPEEDRKNEIINKVIEDKISDSVDKQISDVKNIVNTDVVNSESGKDLVKTNAEIDIENDKMLIDGMYKFMQQQKVPTTPLSSARDKQLRARQASLKLNNLSFSDIDKINASKRLVPEKDISKNIKSINPHMKKIKFNNINKDYIENVLPADMKNAFTSLNDKEMKLFIRDIEIKDHSDELNYLETYRVVLEDEKKQKHTINIDIPKFLDNKFLYIGGNKKIINRQNFYYPVVKTEENKVQIVTNYNKLFLERIGSKSISTVERLEKLIKNESVDEKSQAKILSLFKPAVPGQNNDGYISTIEYDELGKLYSEYKSDNCYIMFSQTKALDYANKHNIEIVEDEMFIGVLDNEPIMINTNTQLQNVTNYSIMDIIVNNFPEELQKEYNTTKVTKKLSYTTITIMSQTIPLMVLLVFWEGISSVIKKLDLQYYFDTRVKELKSNENFIRFKDGYMIYKEDIAIGLLMNGLKFIKTEQYTLEEFNTIEPFVDFFKTKYGRVNVLNALQNYYEFMVDPITKEILEDINLPTGIVELCIYANKLLSDEKYTWENNQTLSRVRSIEIIPAMVYKELSAAYLEYKNSGGKKKLSVPRDAVIKRLLALQTVENYDTLNPMVELEKDRTISSKGFNGVNKDRAYTEAKRTHHDTMVGLIALSTSPDGNCGITRALTLEPTITTERGYVDVKNNKKEELTDVNLFSPAELLYPLGARKDDSVRTAMAVKQSKHVVPVANSSPGLITNGCDEVIKYNLSSDYVEIAEEDGKVIDINPELNIMMVEYKSGKRKAINLGDRIDKNGGGGFYLVNKLVTNLKNGDSFKKNDTLAWHKDFFTGSKVNGVRFNLGTLEKVAITSSYNTFEDSAVITEKMANDCKTPITFCKSVVIGKNATINTIKNVGDHVDIGDVLISFDTSFEDSDLNKLLNNLSAENKDVLNENSVNEIKTKHNGTIVGIKIYSTVEADELSPSLQKIVKKYYKGILDKKKYVSAFDKENTSSLVKCGMLLNETTGKVEPNVYGVLKGNKVEDSVLIEFYVEHTDILGVGSKIAYFTALKGVVGEVIPKGYEPYSEFRPDEEISSFIGPSAILARQTPSITLTVLGNKVLVELKRKLKEIYNS